MRSLSIFLFFVLSSLYTYAQTGTIQGTVKTTDGQPAQYVIVRLEGTEYGSATDKLGQYRIEKVAPGNYTLLTAFTGLVVQKKEIVVVEGKTLQTDIVLHESYNELKEVVISAGADAYKTDRPSEMLRVQTPLIELPQNVQVITKEAIEDQQILDMLEGVSRNVSGAQMIEHWGTFARINMRGFKIPAFRNGMNVDMPWGPLTEDMAIVDRIEFVKGPSGFMLSSGEPGGFYNVVTKKPSLYQQNEITFTAGSFNTLRTTVDIGGKMADNDKQLYRLNVAGLTKGSNRPYEFTNRLTFAPSITYQINDKTSFTAEHIYQYAQLSVVGAAYVFSPSGYGDLPRDFTTAEPNIDPTNINEHSTFLSLNHQINTNWKLTTQLGYIHYKQIGSSIWPTALDSAGHLYRGLSIWDALNEAKLGQVFMNGNFQTGNIQHRLLTGIDIGQKEYYADWSQSGSLGGSENPLDVYNPKHGISSDSIPVFDREKSIRQRALAGSNASQTLRYSSAYLQDELGFLKNRIRLTLAGRYTLYDASLYGAAATASKFSPRAGISVSIDKNTSIYGLFDQSFLPQTGADVNGNAFKPVNADDIEGGIKKDWLKGRWNTTLSIYRITKNNVLTADPENMNFSIQLGQVVSQGVEFDVRGELVRCLNVILNYANTNVEVTEDTNEELIGQRVAGHARHISNGWISYRLPGKVFKGLGLSAGYSYQKDRSSWNWAADNQESLPDYFRLDGAISWQKDAIAVSLNVNNLLNDYLLLRQYLP